MILSTINKKKFTATIAIVLLMTTSLVILANVWVTQAQFRMEGPAGGIPGDLPSGVTPDIYIDTWALLSVRPNPVGVNQPILVNLETQPAPGSNRLHQDYTVVISKPGGGTDQRVLESYPDDGTIWFEYTPTEVGTYEFVFEFLGTYFPVGRYLDGVGPPDGNITSGGSYFDESVYFKPFTTPTLTVEVQEDIVMSWPIEPGPPTDYWTRPVPYERRDWWPYIGNFPWYGPGGIEHGIPLEGFLMYNPDCNSMPPGHQRRGIFTPWVLGPESGHVVWKRQFNIAGLLGADFGTEVTSANIFGGMGLGGDPPGYGYPEIIYAGRAYHTITKPGAGLEAELWWQCYDIRTGELYWEMEAPTVLAEIRGTLVPASVTPTFIEYTIGAIPSGGGFPTHVTEVLLGYIGRGFLIKYRPFTGMVRMNVSIAPLSSGQYYKNGFAMSVQDLGVNATPRYRLINWTTLGTTSNFASRVVSNVSWPWSSLPATTDFEAGYSARVTNVQRAGTYYQINVTSARLSDGEIMWSHVIEAASYSGSCDMADHGKIATLTLHKGFYCWDLATGHQEWISEPMEYPWDMAGFGGYSVQSAYGMLYRQAYSGIYAFNWTDGTIVWKYEAPADYVYETPYINEGGETMYSWNIGAAIADGKMYAYNTEHSATLPITRGWKIHCIDAFTGEGIWAVALPGAASKHNPDVGPIADGYMVEMSSDGYMYVFGKGKSATTVTAPDVAVASGTAMTIKGTVLDQSPAQPGTPCVDVDSVHAWMEKVHIQRDLPAGLVGVPVTLTAIHSDGEVIDLGQVTTNAYYGTFAFSWTPTKQGLYEIVASFEGDASYGSSEAATSVTVGPAPSGGQPQETEEPTTPPPTEEPTTAPPTEEPTTEVPTTEEPTTTPPTEEPSAEAPFPTTEVIIVAAVAVAVVVGIGAYWILRKR
jgi:hypothetical protein